MPDYCLPEDLDELFRTGPTQWYAREYVPEMEMDNVQAMAWFMDVVGISDGDCIAIEDTQIVVRSPAHPFTLCIDSGGLGDFFSHGFDVSIVEEQEK